LHGTAVDPEELHAMSAESAFDKAKGHVKETAGDVTGDDELKAEGRADRGKGKIQEVAEDARDMAAGAVDAVRDKIAGK
jgi:uncharacterized protein YjbJ (UPF0337 family)